MSESELDRRADEHLAYATHRAADNMWCRHTAVIAALIVARALERLAAAVSAHHESRAPAHENPHHG